MEIEKTKNKTKCDMYGCKNFSDYTLKLNKMFFAHTHFCKDCLNNFYRLIGKEIVPKPVEPPFKVKKIR